MQKQWRILGACAVFLLVQVAELQKMALRMTRIRQFEIQNQKKFWEGDNPSPEKFLGSARPQPRLQVLDPPLCKNDW